MLQCALPSPLQAEHPPTGRSSSERAHLAMLEWVSLERWCSMLGYFEPISSSMDSSMISNGERCDSLRKHVTSSPKPIGSISAQVEPETPVIPDKLCDKEFTLSGAGGSRTPVQTSNACSVLHAQSTIDFRPEADRGRPISDLAL